MWIVRVLVSFSWFYTTIICNKLCRCGAKPPAAAFRHADAKLWKTSLTFCLPFRSRSSNLTDTSRIWLLCERDNLVSEHTYLTGVNLGSGLRPRLRTIQRNGSATDSKNGRYLGALDAKRRHSSFQAGGPAANRYGGH